MHKLSVGIIGAAGYTAGELIRILHNHPNVNIIIAQSESQKGNKISTIHTDLFGDIESEFQDTLDEREVDVVFLCKGHGQSITHLKAPAGLYSIKTRLGQDFVTFGSHEFVHGLPEMSREFIRKANYGQSGMFRDCHSIGFVTCHGYINC